MSEELFQVKVGQPGQRTQLVNVKPGMTADEVCALAGFQTGSKDIRVGTEKVRGSHVVKPGDMLLVSPRIDAGHR